MTTFDVTQRIVIHVDTYEKAGEILDRINAVTAHALGAQGTADFVNFNTRPCKAVRMDAMMYSENTGERATMPDQPMTPVSEGSRY